MVKMCQAISRLYFIVTYPLQHPFQMAIIAGMILLVLTIVGVYLYLKMSIMD